MNNEVDTQEVKEAGLPTMKIVKTLDSPKAESPQAQHKRKLVEQQEMLRQRNEYKKSLRENIELLELQHRELELSLKIHDLQQVRTKIVETENQKLKELEATEKAKKGSNIILP